VLDCASNPEINIIISNTTEVGITLVQDDIRMAPPISFPGKLLAFLYERYRVLGRIKNAGMVILPTELIIDNGSKLKAILLELAEMNKLGKEFISWLENENHFCNTLVDRIVPGALATADLDAAQHKLGYEDELMIMAETFRLWAIESDEPIVKQILSFAKADEGIVIAPDIEKFRELKLRLLNGTHTFACGLAYLAGFDTVKEAMKDENFISYVKGLMLHEICPAVVGENISEEEARAFSASVTERFQNPFLEHQWIAITMQYSSKMKMRNLPILKKHYQRNAAVPEHMALGFAAFLLFLKGSAENPYPIKDDNAGYFIEKWKNHGSATIAEAILADTAFWGEDLAALPGFAEAVKNDILEMEREGVSSILNKLVRHKSIVA
jgi:tagaturonate reductase